MNQPLVPPDALPGGPEFTLTVNGTGFVEGASVDWNGAPLSTTFVSESKLTATVPAANVSAAGTASVTVVNPGTTVASNVVYFPIALPRSLVTFAMTPASPIYGLAGTPMSPAAIAAADFNGDGDLDLALTYCPYPISAGGPGSLRVLAGSGDGTFKLLPSSSPIGTNSNAMVVGDFNGDGKADLAIVNSCPTPVGAVIPNFIGNNVTILLGNGDGTFATPQASPVPVGSCPFGVAAGDFNGDGKLDLAVANSNDNTVSILLGKGDGTFTPAPGSPVPAGNTPMALAVGDFNGDGKLDLAVADFNLTVTILLGNGNGSFTAAPGSPITLAAGTSIPPYDIAAGDFNGDGKLDLTVGGWDNDTVTVLLGNGDGTFTSEAGCCGTSQYNGIRVMAMVSGDFSGNGGLDLALADELYSTGNSFQLVPTTDYATTMRGNGDGTFTPSEFSLLVSPYTMALVAGDFNGDGKLDLAQTAVNGVSVLLQAPLSGNGPAITIAPTGKVAEPFPPGTTSATVEPGGTATFSNLMVFSLNGFTGPVALSCSGAPLNATCSVAPSSVDLSAALLGAGFTMSIVTASPTPSLTSPRLSPPWAPPGALMKLLAALLGLMCIALFVRVQRPWRARSRSWAIAPLLAVLLSIGLCLACGAGTTHQPVNGTPPGTYTITVNATSGSVSSSAPFTLVVQ